MPKISAQQRQDRRLQILQAATRCFARKGFHGASMEDIVRESRLSPGAIYCYFRGKRQIVAAIAQERHSRESALLAGLAASPNLAEGLDGLARSFFAMLQDPGEKQRRKVSIQVWAESLHDRHIRQIVERGLRQRDPLVRSLRDGQRAGQLPAGLDAESLSRVLLALLQGFILQQAWEPDLDAGGYLETVTRLLGCVIRKPADVL